MRATGVLCLAAVGAVSLVGCRKQLSCEAISERNKQCADAFVESAKQRTRAAFDERLAAMPPAARDEAQKRLEARLTKNAQQVRRTVSGDAFLTECRADWGNAQKVSPALKTGLGDCMRHDDCRAYADCFLQLPSRAK